MSLPSESRHEADPPRYNGPGRGHLHPDRVEHWERVKAPDGCHEQEGRNLAAAVIALAYQDVERKRTYFPDEGDAAAFLSRQSLWLDVLGWDCACLCGRSCRKEGYGS